MKYVVLILLCALRAQADDFVCTMNNKEIIKIYGLSRFVENHQATLIFDKSIHPNPNPIDVDVTTTKVKEFVDWGGQGLKIDRLLEAIVLPYPTFHFKIEMTQSVGGDCEQFGCEQSAKFYHDGKVEPLVCKPATIQNVFDHPRTTMKSSIPETSSDDWCLSTCDRRCLEKPVFCGMW